MISHLHSPTGQQKIIVIQKREKTAFGRARKQDGDQFVRPQVEGGNPDVQTAPALAGRGAVPRGHGAQGAAKDEPAGAPDPSPVTPPCDFGEIWVRHHGRR